MPDGSEKEYKFGPKNNWRRSVWNDVVGRLGHDRTKSLVLYLAGPDDLDRSIATSKGIPSHNLIAIDRSQRNVDKVRKERALAVRADVVEVLKAWPKERPVGAVMLDLCCGLEMNLVYGLNDVLHRFPFRTSVIMVNLQRGRDASSGELRRLGAGVSAHILGRCAPKLGGDIALSQKNRAVAFYGAHNGGLIPKLLQYFRRDINTPGQVDAVVDATFEIQQPTFYTYRSGTLVFDSVVFNALGMLSWPGLEWLDANTDDLIGRDRDVSRRISATLAVRTARLRGAI